MKGRFNVCSGTDQFANKELSQTI